MINYPNYVNLSKIDCDKINLFNTIHQRTYLTIPLPHNTQENACIILMNPATADCAQSDNTVNKIINYFNQYKFESITILNLFPIYDPNSSNLYNSLQLIKNSTTSLNLSNIIDNNLNIISKYINRSNKIILAWGDCPKKNSKITTSTTFNSTLFYNTTCNILKLLIHKTNLYCFKFNNSSKLTQYGNPYHTSRKGDILGIYKLTLDSYLLTLS
ncbi:DUF1643 domain-containing protein [Clostridium tertium]|uniref:DUF1643 domain-containing protein n=1 Tax=Clostridium tertium TaxID=1559 RepID=UPI00232AD284|nr:DUF1643 domain-containing protein [Clostridium tertium]MDB1954233.1 DUF1643 domain-containing protein [Clostridium tertium]MDB1965021.1 DUF1643 domain-containing protein [Clostridium tertium]